MLLKAEKVPLHAFEKAVYFEGYLPVEVMAERRYETLTQVTSREEMLKHFLKKDLESHICKWHCRVMSQAHVDAGNPVYVFILTDGGSQEGAGDDPPDITCFMAQT